MSRKLRIVYMGTPDFAVGPLNAILKAGYDIAAIITVPDKPAGRGQKLQHSAVKKYAIEHNLPVIQPNKLKDSAFLKQLSDLKANLFIVVAFRMLPEQVWNMPEYGTLNLHASLLPQYRGAAPINHAIINGETITGVTTFFIEREIDTGKIILADEVPIDRDDNAGTLHDKLMIAGSAVILKTIKLIEDDKVISKDQADFVHKDIILKTAPKIFKEDGCIDWSKEATSIYNFIRGLSPYPGAYTYISSPQQEFKLLKLFNCDFEPFMDNIHQSGDIVTDNKTYFKIACKDGLINIFELQYEGKKRMSSSEFMRGFNLTNASIKQSAT